MRTAGMVVLGLMICACAAAATSTTTATTTSAPLPAPSTIVTSTATPPGATTTTQPPAPLSLINGLEVEDETALDRRVLAVKIDNHPSARPHSGIEDADMVIELLVEEVTRFLTIWHQSDSEYLGPVRSGRPTDATLLHALGEPTFAISGAQEWIYGVLTARDLHLLGQRHDGLFRIPSRAAPHDLYADTVELRATADSLGYADQPPPRPLWEFGPMSALADPVDAVRIQFDGNVVNWFWDPVSGLWLRSTFDTPSMWRNRDGETGRIGVPVLVVLYAEQYTAHPPGTGTPVPATRTVGSGRVFVLANGSVTEGTWTRGSESDWFFLTDSGGEVLLVPPGKVWVSLVPPEPGLSFPD